MAEEEIKAGKIEETSGDVERNKQIKKEMVRKEIETNPYLLPLKNLLRDPEFIEASGISEERIIERYMEYDSDIKNPIDAEFILDTTINIIKEVNETLNGLVYSLSGIKDDKLSQEQRQIMESELPPKEKIEKLSELTRKEYEIFKSIVRENVISSDEREKLLKDLGLENAKEKAEQIAKDEVAAFIETDADKEMAKLSYELVRARTDRERNRILRRMKEECGDSKFYDTFKDKDGNLTVESVTAGRKNWERQKNIPDIKNKLTEFQRKSEKYETFQSLPLEDRIRFTRAIFRANNSNDPEAIGMAESLAKRYKVHVFTRGRDDKGQIVRKISNDYVRKMYQSLTPRKLTSYEIEEELKKDDFSEENIDNSLRLLDEMPTDQIAKGSIDNSEKAQMLRATYKAMNLARHTQAKVYSVKKGKELVTRKEIEILKKLYEIDFSKEETQLELIKYYAMLSRKSQNKSVVHDLLEKGVVYGNEVEGSDADIIKRFMIRNPQFFGDVVNDGEHINHNQVKEISASSKIDYSNIERRIDIAGIEQVYGKKANKEFVRTSNGKILIIPPSAKQKEKYKKSNAEKLVQDITRKLRFPIEINAVTFLATYVQLKHFDSMDPNTSKEEKELNKQICAAMQRVITDKKNKPYFSAYLDQQGNISMESANKAYEDYIENILNESNSRDNDKSIKIDTLLEVINKFKERNGIDKKRIPQKVQEQERESKKNESKSKGFLETVRDKVKEVFTNDKEKDEKNGIQDVIASVIEQGKNIAGKIIEGVQKAIESRNTKRLEEGKGVEEGVSFDESSLNDTQDSQEQLSFGQMPKEERDKIAQDTERMLSEMKAGGKSGQGQKAISDDGQQMMGDQ